RLLTDVGKQVVAAGLHANQDFAIDHVAGQDTEVSDSTTTNRPSTHLRVLVLPDPRVPHERGLPGVLRVLQHLGDGPIDQPFGGGRGGRHEPRRRIARSRLGMVRVEFVEPRATRHNRERAQPGWPHGTPTGIPDLGEFGGVVHYSCPSGFHPAIGTSIILTVARMKGLSPVPSTIWCWAMRMRLCIW